MSAKAFLDTNIFTYSMDQVDVRKASVAIQLIREQAKLRKWRDQFSGGPGIFQRRP